MDENLLRGKNRVDSFVKTPQLEGEVCKCGKHGIVWPDYFFQQAQAGLPNLNNYSIEKFANESRFWASLLVLLMDFWISNGSNGFISSRFLKNRVFLWGGGGLGGL